MWRSRSRSLTSAETSVTFASGYYDEFTVTTDVANVPDAKVTYTLGHKHVGGEGGGACYQTPYQAWVNGTHSIVGDYDNSWGGTFWRCTRCGETWYNQGHPGGGSCPNNRIQVTKYKLSCEKDEAVTWTTTDGSHFDEGDFIVSALIEYN